MVSTKKYDSDIFCFSYFLLLSIVQRFITDVNWLSQCSVSLSSCGNLLAVGFKNRLCLLTTQWISSTDSNTYLISWSGTLPSDITALLALSICPSQQSSQVFFFYFNYLFVRICFLLRPMYRVLFPNVVIHFGQVFIS